MRRDTVIRRESTIVKGLFAWSTVAGRVEITGFSIRVRSAVVHDFLELSFVPSIKEVRVKVPSTVDSRNSVAIGENVIEVGTAIIRNPNKDLHLW